jgi:hypothetical protein
VIPYYVFGIALAAWAVVVAGLGSKFGRFPGSRGGERLVIAVTVLLVAGTLGSAIILGAGHETGGEGGHAAGDTSGEH